MDEIPHLPLSSFGNKRIEFDFLGSNYIYEGVRADIVFFENVWTFAGRDMRDGEIVWGACVEDAIQTERDEEG